MYRVYKIKDTDVSLKVYRDGKTVSVEDRYITSVSSKGKEYRKIQRGRNLALVSNGLGYLQIKVQVEKSVKRFYVHRVVWEAYNGIIPKNYEIDHIDNNKSNNSLDNLRLVTRKENMHKCFKDNPHIIRNLLNSGRGE